MPAAGQTYPVADLTVETTFKAEGRPEVDPEKLAGQLKHISDSIAPVLAKTEVKEGFGLQTIEIALTLGAEGGVWFVAKGSAEASITVTFGRGEA